MNKLFVNRIGLNNEAYMKTIRIENTFDTNSKVIWKNNTLKITDKPVTIKPYKLNKPKRIKINIKISENNISTESNNNILGVNNYIFIEDEILKIPVEIATNYKLNYYLCSLIEDGDVFKLENNNIIQNFYIKVGENYLKDYILQSKLGDGLYIEKHNAPHFHQPLNNKCTGYLILGKIKRDELILTAFSIPYGKAVYTPSNIFHCDACLIGDYNVIYSIAENYNTYLIYNEMNKKIVNVEFIDYNL